jgi:hypothetical protein
MQQTIEITKRCPKCNRIYTATPEFFYRDRARRDGLHTYCKTCESADLRSFPRDMQIPNYDGNKMWREKHCEKCQKTTDHVYCQSIVNDSKTVYACYECYNEVEP